MNYKLISNLILFLRAERSFITKTDRNFKLPDSVLQEISSQLLGKNNFSCNVTTPLIPAIVKREASQEVESLSLIDTYSKSEIIGKIFFFNFLFVRSSYDIIWILKISDYDAQSVISSEYSHNSSSSFPVTPTFSKAVTNSIRKKRAFLR